MKKLGNVVQLSANLRATARMSGGVAALGARHRGAPGGAVGGALRLRETGDGSGVGGEVGLAQPGEPGKNDPCCPCTSPLNITPTSR